MDPGSGRVLGHDGTPLDGFWGLLENLHICMLTCTRIWYALTPGMHATAPAVAPAQPPIPPSTSGDNH